MSKPEQKDDTFTLKEHYSFGELLTIMAFLRSDEGCPWDRAQTHESIAGNMLEEAYEAVVAIGMNDPAALQEELGDVLMQVIFHSDMAEAFTIRDVISGICRKLISRHTHLFGDDQADTPEKVLRTWEKNKQIEKGFLSVSDSMRDVPRGMPALTRAFKIQKKAANVGFDWTSVDGAMRKIEEELAELFVEVEKGDKKRTEEEAGDLLFTIVNILRLLDLDPETALTGCTERFIGRFSTMEEEAEKGDVKLSDLDLDELEALWVMAKKRESQQLKDV